MPAKTPRSTRGASRPAPAAALSPEEMAAATRWAQTGERGMSSEAIWTHMTGGRPIPTPSSATEPSWPMDADDFRRCYLLLEAVPTWRARIGEMAQYGPHWEGLADIWEGVTELLRLSVSAPSTFTPEQVSRFRGMVDKMIRAMNITVELEQANAARRDQLGLAGRPEKRPDNATAAHPPTTAKGSRSRRAR